MDEVRCPEGRLFWKIRPDGNLEVACRDCRVQLKDPMVAVVLHVFTPDGELVATETFRFVTHHQPG